MSFTIQSKTTLTSVDRAADLFLLADASASNAVKNTTVNYLLDLTSHPVGVDDTQTLTAKTLDNSNIVTLKDSLFTLQDNSDTTKQAVFQLSGISTGTTRTYTFPNATTTLVGTDATQTLTNKTLTSPTINTATISNPTLTVDTISEFTSANGVTIDGMLIKDNTVGPGTITPAGLVSGTGSSWTPQSWTATLTNLSGGTQSSQYIQIGKIVFYQFKYTLAGAGVAGSVTFSLPVTASSNYTVATTTIGDATFVDTGTGQTNGVARLETTTTALLLVFNSASTYTLGSVLSSTVPHTWANTDVIVVQGWYVAA